ncbi:MAG: hypothetical protein ACRDD1_16550, partial [Planctomycetia bacterium]
MRTEQPRRTPSIHGAAAVLTAVVFAAVVQAADAVDPVKLIGDPTEIVVEPATVSLKGPRQYQFLLVTGKYADGTVRDLTHVAKYATSNDKVAVVTAAGLASSTGDGAANIVVQAGSRQAVAAVTVAEFAKPDPVSFHNEVVAAVTKTRCNSGACHGTPTGKNGFRLSLLGYLPDQDFNVLTRETFARRTNPLDADGSLVLAKGSA